MLRLLAPGLALACLLAPLSPAAAEPGDCEGRNPLYCNENAEPEAKAAAEPPAAAEAPDPNVLVDPPGGCEGRNPLYCRETKPEVEVKPEEPERKQRANTNSRNPNRNPSRNPNRNPRRRPASGQ